MLEVGVVTSPTDFESLRDDWDDCLHRCPPAAVFVAWEWLHTWWRHYGEHQPLRIAVARRSGRVVGILPLYIQRRPTLGGVHARVLRPIGRGGDTAPDYLGPIVDEEQGSREVISSLCRAVVADGSWDAMDLTDFVETSAYPEIMEATCRSSGLRVQRKPFGLIPVTELPPTWDGYLATLTKDQRHNIRRARRRLIEEHGARLFVWEDACSLDRAIDRLGELHRLRWESRTDHCSFSTDRYIDFHRDVMHACQRRGWLRLYCLELRGELVAINYAYAFRDELALFQCGFDPQLEKLRLGYVLVGWSIEQAIAEGLRVFDFLKGEYAYKRIWAPQSRAMGLLHAYRMTPRGLAFGLRRHLLPQLRRWLPKARPAEAGQLQPAQG